MPTEKIADIDQEKGAPRWGYTERQCRHREHNPPTMMVFSPGVWQHTCPGCGKSIVFTVYPSHIVTKDNLAVQPHVRPVGHVVLRPAHIQKDDGSNPMHAFGQGRGDANTVRETHTCSMCGEQLYKHHIC